VSIDQKRRSMAMPITNRNLPAGTVLAARYKGQTYRCTVLENEGKLAFSLDDNSIHPSPSAAASKVMGGTSANGWRFWSLEGDLPEKPAKEPKAAKAGKAAPSVATKMVKTIKKLPNQKGVPEGSTKWFCSGCMKSFVAAGSNMPETCPEGHAREMADEFAVVPQEASEAE
jgi:hypothetical protein